MKRILGLTMAVMMFFGATAFAAGTNGKTANKSKVQADQTAAKPMKYHRHRRHHRHHKKMMTKTTTKTETPAKSNR